MIRLANDNRSAALDRFRLFNTNNGILNQRYKGQSAFCQSSASFILKPAKKIRGQNLTTNLFHNS